MSKRVKVEGKIITVPDDATPDEIDSISKGIPPSSEVLDRQHVSTQAGVSAKPPLMSIPGIKSAFYSAADKVTNALPTIGGAGGGLLGLAGGVPGAVAGATIGGAGGESARQLARRELGFEVPKTSSDAAESIGGEGIRQGAYELGGQAIGRVGKAVAPKLAEAAVAPGKRMLKSIPEDVNIGRTILDESSAVRPKAIVKELTNKIGEKSDAVDYLSNQARMLGKNVDLVPARELVDKELASATAKNSPGYLKDVSKLKEQLTHQFDQTGKPLSVPSTATKQGAGFAPSQVPVGGTRNIALPSAVDPVRARALKQGVDLEIGNWNPEAQSAIAPLQERVRGAINSGFHAAVPGAAELDKSMTSMIPARDAMWNTSFNPSITRSVMDRIARPTGALVGSTVGGVEGYKHGGVPGAIIGGVGGLVVPHMLTNPTAMMIGARGLENQVPSRALRYSIPALESQRKRKEDLDAEGSTSQEAKE